MDAVSVCDEHCVISEINQTTAEGPALSEIPKVSLCPPDSEDAESPMNEVPIEGDHINHLSTPPSSSQLYDQVLQSHAYQSPRLKRCPCCNHQQPITDVCLNQTNVSSHSDCASNAVKTVNKSSPFHQPTCHNTMQCHWLQGSRDGSNYKPVQHHVVTVRTERLHRIPKNYSQVIVEYPMTVLISCAVVLLAFSLAGILIGPLPDFSDPLAGFEPRGTDIGIRLAAWAKLQESTGPGKALSLTSKQFEDQSIAREVTSKTQQHLRHRSRRMLHTDTTENAYFCNDPGDRYAQLVFRSGNSDSLWSLKAIYSMCEMEQTQIRSDVHFKELCQVKSKSEAAGNKGKGECCPSWSLGNFLALLNNVSSCFSLTAQQVSDSLSLLRYCAPYYHDGSLVASCAERSKYGYCASVPHSCKHSSIIYQILHYLVDKDFLGPQTVEYQFRYIWICCFAVLAAGGIYISCVDPGMKLPSSDSRATQLFRSSHPFERYDAEYRHQFMFERMKQGEDKPMTMTLIWGVTPANDDDRFNPRSNGSFTMDPEFNMSSSEAQVWLRKLCGKIRNQSFYSTSPADQEAVVDNTCFVEDLIHWVSIRRCSENEDAFSFCCNNITFPYPPSVFERCLKMMTEERQAETGAEAGNNNPSANGTFSCGTGTGSQGRRNCNKEGGGAFLCPNQHRHRQHQSRLGREPEQYELQPLACHLSDSFENSTCTSKLSNRPSVLSDDIEFCGLSPKRYYDRISTESVSEEICSRHLKRCDNPQAVQTSSPYKGNKTRPVVVPPGDLAKEKRLCKKCHSGPGIKLWNISLSSSSMEDITVTETTDDTNKRSLSMDGAYRCHAHKRLLSCQSQSSIEGLEDSNETCLSDIEPAVSIAPPTVTEGELRPGHLNGKRDTLRLSLRETVYDPGSPGSGRGRTSQSELPVILPNSQPDLPDVWIKRDGRGEDSS
ncbi:hypothetical protein PHYPO_G00017530 [Pangasianodon hypophthalmus]|uniref:SSD domain-containing protein n=1 Tax=Pangasianodon hypophthalmus TaxID=310915 RepID=A0A5N5N4R5_PANHP|nr:hypothetical protein PHYPO_G00017530 [Pangasianodon hypophthalmus]